MSQAGWQALESNEFLLLAIRAERDKAHQDQYSGTGESTRHEFARRSIRS